MQIGDKVRSKITVAKTHGLGNGTEKSYDGEVVFIHSKGRFYTVSFTLPGGKVCESFSLHGGDQE